MKIRKTLILSLILSVVAYGEERYQLLVDIKSKDQLKKLESLGFRNCKVINQNTMLCLESQDISYVQRLRDFLRSQNLEAKISKVELNREKVENQNETKEKYETQVKNQVREKTELNQRQPIKNIGNLPKSNEKNKTSSLEREYIIKNSLTSNKKEDKEIENKKEIQEDELKKMYVYLNSDNLDNAEFLAKKLLNSKYSLDAKFVIGLVNLKRENFKEACHIFSSIKSYKKEARDLEIDSCWVFYMQEGYKNLESGNLNQALENFKTSLSYKDNLESKLGTFYVYLKQKNYSKAESLIKNLLEKYDNNLKVKRAYIDYLIETKNFKELQKYEDLLTVEEKELIKSQNIYSELDKARKLIEDGEYDTAEAILKNLYLKNNSNIYVLLTLGYLYLKKGDIYSAENYYKNVLMIDKNNKDALQGLKAVYVKLGKYEEALDIIEKLKSMGIKDEDGRKIKELYYISKAQESVEKKDLRNGEIYALEVLKLNPLNSTAYLILANIYKEKGDNEAYFKYLSKAYEIDPDNFGIKLAYMYGLANFGLFDQVKIILSNIDKNRLSQQEKQELRELYKVLYNKLASYYLNNKDYIRAKKVALEGLSVFTTDSGLLEILGWSCYNLKDYECSKKAFESVITFSKDNEMALLGLAYSYLNLKETDKTLNILKKLENSKNPKVLEGVVTIYLSLDKVKEADRVFKTLQLVQQKEQKVDSYIDKKTQSDLLLDKTQPKQLSVDFELPLDKIQENIEINIKPKETPWPNIQDNLTERKIDEIRINPLSDNKNVEFSPTNMEVDEKNKLQQLKEKIEIKKQNYLSYIEVGTKFRAKSGEDGKSKLTDTSPYIMVDYFLNENINIYAGSYFPNLNSGELKDYQHFGSPSNLTILRQVPSTYSGVEPFVGGEINTEKFIISTHISTTPIVNSGISKTVVYQLEGKIKTEENKFGLGIYRKPIRDSILSYVGTIDPYTSNTSWGRATEEGVKASFENSTESYLLYSEFSLGKIKGKDIQDNNRLTAMVISKFNIESIIGDKDYAGVFFMYDSFSKDQDCYYYGCGGYFSPRRMLILAPMFEGFKYFNDKFGLHYKVFLGLLGLDNKGKFSLDTSFDGYIGGIYKLNKNIFLNAAAEYRKTSKYNEIFSSLSLQYFFGTRYNIIENDLIKQEKEIYKK
ncbi:MAG: cellulose synthase subunit BcsC-related outer membrane protein [Hydrogenothermaceae bacterium]